jgi:hypothetical protein
MKTKIVATVVLAIDHNEKIKKKDVRKTLLFRLEGVDLETTSDLQAFIHKVRVRDVDFD